VRAPPRPPRERRRRTVSPPVPIPRSGDPWCAPVPAGEELAGRTVDPARRA
jgi:hypothetical protein